MHSAGARGSNEERERAVQEAFRCGEPTEEAEGQGKAPHASHGRALSGRPKCRKEGERADQESASVGSPPRRRRGWARPPHASHDRALGRRPCSANEEGVRAVLDRPPLPLADVAAVSSWRTGGVHRGGRARSPGALPRSASAVLVAVTSWRVGGGSRRRRARVFGALPRGTRSASATPPMGRDAKSVP